MAPKAKLCVSNRKRMVSTSSIAAAATTTPVASRTRRVVNYMRDQDRVPITTHYLVSRCSGADGAHHLEPSHGRLLPIDCSKYIRTLGKDQIVQERVSVTTDWTISFVGISVWAIRVGVRYDFEQLCGLTILLERIGRLICQRCDVNMTVGGGPIVPLERIDGGNLEETIRGSIVQLKEIDGEMTIRGGS
uniref:Uncharacterized protein n=1 Tax=Asparagus officinalis TaxID=4686 RepID=Q2AA13_ASPOF|nr:hypothetical protein 20.t00047 [Asparagus officinalis]